MLLKNFTLVNHRGCTLHYLLQGATKTGRGRDRRQVVVRVLKFNTSHTSNDDFLKRIFTSLLNPFSRQVCNTSLLTAYRVIPTTAWHEFHSCRYASRAIFDHIVLFVNRYVWLSSRLHRNKENNRPLRNFFEYSTTLLDTQNYNLTFLNLKKQAVKVKKKTKRKKKGNDNHSTAAKYYWVKWS